MNAIEKILDRIEKSFFLYKKGFINLSIPYLVYNVIWIVILPYILIITFFPLFTSFFSWFFNQFNISYIFIFLFPVLFLIIFYILFFIIIFLMTIKTIKFYYDNKQNNEHNSLKQEFNYSRKNIWTIMKTYRYIFAYVALIPSIIFILWGLFFNISFFFWLDSLFSTIWWILMWTWVVLFIVFAIYRWIRASFALYNAISYDDYTKGNFDDAINMTKGNWWRILLNSLVIWIIISLLSWIINNIIGLLVPGWFNAWFVESITNWNFSILQSFNYFLLSLLKSIVNSIWAVFMAIFMYLLYKDIQEEYQDPNFIKSSKSKKYENEL